jgi:hypothetical protein
MNIINSFLKDIILRLFGKSPKFFQIIKIVGSIAALLTGIPVLLENSGVILPEYLQVFASKIVSIASIVAVFIAQLTVVDTSKLNIK